MGAAGLRAKVLGVRAMSTILLTVSLATTAQGQVFGFPAPSYGNSLWITARVISVLSIASTPMVAVSRGFALRAFTCSSE